MVSYSFVESPAAPLISSKYLTNNGSGSNAFLQPANVQSQLSLFSEHHEEEAIITQGDMVVYVVNITGTNTGNFFIL
jgi:hypothetical protein